MRPAILLPFSLLFLLIGSCVSDPSVKPSSIGKLSELVVVADSTLWKGPAGRSLVRQLSSGYPGLLQDEPDMVLSTFQPAAFTGFLRTHQNILLVEEAEPGQPLQLSADRNRWAQPQLVATLKIPAGPGTTEKELDAAGYRVAEAFRAEERDRLVHAYRTAGNDSLAERVFRQFGFYLNMPHDFFEAKTGPGFLWLRKETVHTSVGILVYVTGMGDSTVSLASVIGRRDSVGKRYVPGPVEGTYMATDTSYRAVVYADEIDGMKALLVRSLWRIEGDFMGGPFISAILDDPAANRRIAIECFVYAPKYDKRNYMKRAEAILYTFRRAG